MTKKAYEIVFSIFLIIIGIFAYIETYSFRFIQSSIFPRISLILLFLLSLTLILETIAISKNKTKYVKKDRNINNAKKTLSIFITLAYISIISFLGFYTATFLYVTSLMFYLGVKNIKKLFFISIMFVLFAYIVFKIILGLPTPYGIFI